MQNMTSIGHSLTGIALGVLSLPQQASPRRCIFHVAAFTLLPNLPDLSLPGWGHDRYYFSHSLFVNLLLMLAALVVCAWGRRLRNGLGGWPVLGAAAGAWLSHLLLDSFYNHGLGVAIFWPFSTARLNLTLPWFSILDAPLWSWQALRVSLIELAFYLPLVGLAVGYRWLRGAPAIRPSTNAATKTAAPRINECRYSLPYS